MTAISTFVVLRLVDGNQGQAPAYLRYNTADPYTVHLDFGTTDDTGQPNVWTFARDLLADALTQPAGYGDVRCGAAGEWFYITLANTSTAVTFRCQTRTVRSFLVETEDLVPYGSEAINFDAELDALLKDGAR